MLPDADAVRRQAALDAPAAEAFQFLAARILAAYLGGFALLNILGDAVSPRFNANAWWIDWHPLAPVASQLILLAAAVAMVAFALRPRMSRARQVATRLLLAGLLLGTLCNAAAFFAVAGRHGVVAGMPIPLSLLVAVTLVWLLAMTSMTPPATALTRRWRIAAVLLAGGLAVAFPLAQMICFGKTDYRRPADAIVVFGAGVNRDGSCSEALADRVSTACRLYSEGYADRLIFSGGPGRGDVHETEGMRRLAVSLGVPTEAIILDQRGVSTQATVKSTAELLPQLGMHRILAVSHWYHLPRVKMAYQRAGVEVYTVPAEQRRNLPDWPWLISREVAALWAYYLRPLAA